MEGGAAASPTVSVRAGVQGWSGETDTFGSGDKPEDSTALPVPPWGWDAGLLGSLLVTLGGGQRSLGGREDLLQAACGGLCSRRGTSLTLKSKKGNVMFYY